jgi:hypothetical protein
MATVHCENGDSTTPSDEALIKQIAKTLSHIWRGLTVLPPNGKG